MQLSKIFKSLIIGSSISLVSVLSVFANTTAIIKDDNINVYAVANDESTIISVFNAGKEVTIITQEDDWLAVESEELKNVYIPKDSVMLIQAEAVVTDDSVNVRQKPSLDAPILGQTNASSNVVLTAKVGEWYEVDYNGTYGYIYGAYVEGNFLSALPEEEIETIEMEVQDYQQNQNLGQQIADYAQQFEGTPYVYGGTNLSKGVDCSGFTSSVMKHFGIYISRTSKEQINNGVRIDKSQLQAGDLVFFNKGGNTGISHVGLYIGNGKFIHSASSWSGGVIISSLNQSYYANTYVGATRVI